MDWHYWLQLLSVFALPLLGNLWCCCDPPIDCTVFEDDFTGEDGTSIGSGFTETTGDATRDSGTLKFTTTGAVATCNTDSPVTARAIVVDGKASTANNLGRILVGDWKVEVKFSTTAGAVRLIDPGGTIRASTATNLDIPLNTFVSIGVCYDGEYLEAEITGIDKTYVRVKPDPAITDLTNGLGTGGTVSGSVAFDNWELLQLNEDCACPFSPGGGDQGCPYCTGFTGPYYWMVVIAGVTNNICTNCNNWNGVYILTPNSNNFCFVVNENTRCCCWTAPNGGDACSENIPPNRIEGEYAQCTLQVCATYDGFPAGIRVRMYHARTGGLFVFQEPIATPIDCLGVSNLDIPVLVSAPALCTTSSATCTATAL
jgi:hypothetical protein